MNTDAYVTFLVLGVLLIAVDGQIIYRSGLRYLRGAADNEDSAASMIRLVTVLFHLTVLGVLALLSTVDIGGSTMPAVVGRLGVLLLLLAIAHGIAVAVLGRIHDGQIDETIVRNRQAQAGTQQSTTVTPVPGQRGGAQPQVSPGLEHDAAQPAADT